MSDRDTSCAAESTHCLSAPDPPTQCSSSGYPPSGYSAVASHPATVCSNNPDSGTRDTTHYSHGVKSDHIAMNPIAKDSAAETYALNGNHQHGTVTDHIGHDTTSNAPFPDLTPGSGSRNVGYVERPNLYKPQPAYNPSYMAEKQNYSGPTVHGRQTIVLQRTDADNARRRRRQIIVFCIGLFVFAIVFITAVSHIISMLSR